MLHRAHDLTRRSIRLELQHGLLLQRSLLSSQRSIDYNSFFSEVSRRRQPSAIRALMPLLQIPGMISLGGGLPNPETFPFKSMTVELKSGASYELAGADLDRLLQYSPTNGLPTFLEHLETLRQAYHKIDAGGEDGDYGIPRCSMVSTGSQDALSKAFEMLLMPGESLLLESPTYSGSLAFLRPLGVFLAGVETDGGGLKPDRLEEMLENWVDVHGTQPPKPRVLYTIPNGSNPTGGSLDEERRRHIYAIARRHDLLIIEDDPYYYLQYGDGTELSSSSSSSLATGLAPSFMALDEDGRVLRFDSMSKVLSAGLRLGWATGPAPLIDRLQLHMQSTSLHASGLAQGVVSGLFDSWSGEAGAAVSREAMLDGWEAHVASIVKLYRGRRDVFLECAERHLGAASNGGEALAEWSKPAAGMFCWLKLLGINDSLSLVKEKAVDAKVLFVPGGEFMPENHRVPLGPPPVYPFVRASFSTATEEDMDEALRRLAEVVREARAEAAAAEQGDKAEAV